MRDSRPQPLAALGLVVGAVLGMAGTFVPSPSLRGLLWGLDGTALIAATALLSLHHFRRGHDTVAAGFLVFVAGETLIVVGSAMDLDDTAPLFGAGVKDIAVTTEVRGGYLSHTCYWRTVADGGSASSSLQHLRHALDLSLRRYKRSE